MDEELDPLLFSCNRTRVSRGSNFTENEKRLLRKLVEKYPPIHYRGGITKDIRMKKQLAWTQLTREYNCYPGVTHRSMNQLRVAYDNSRRIRNKRSHNISISSQDMEQFEELISMKGLQNDGEHDQVDTIISSTPSKPETKNIKREIVSDDSDAEPQHNNNRVQNEEQAKIRRVMLNIRQDRVLFNLKRKRESIALAREKNLLEYEKTIHKLKVRKLELEIETHAESCDDYEKDNLDCNGEEGTIISLDDKK